MIRKYDIKNKRYFIIVGIIFLVLIFIFSFFVYRYLTKEEDIYTALSGSYLLDSSNNSLLLSSNATIEKKWTGKYLVTYDDGKVMRFDDNLLVYNNGSLFIYGKFYEVLLDGSVSILEGKNDISNISKARFFKLDDRKYLVVSPNINSSDESVSANNFLFVYLDKQGNAMLVNDSLNLKTISKTTLITNLYSFDIASEKLTINDKVIDLKKIIGSSNLYKEIKSSDNTSLENDVSDSSNNVNENSNSVNDNIIVNNSEEVKDVIDSNITNMSTSVLDVSATYTSISCNYVIYDPFNVFTSIYAEVYDESGNFIKKINLNREGNLLVIDNLDYDTLYKLIFKYSYIKDNKEDVKTFYEQSIKTKSANFSIRVNKISTLKGIIDYDIILDNSFLDEVAMDESTISFNASLLATDYVDSAILSKSYSSGSSYISGSFNLPSLSIGEVVTLKINSFSLDNQESDNLDVIYQFKYK